MHDTVPDDDVRRPNFGPVLHLKPLLSLELGEQLLADGPVVTIGVARRLALRRRQCPHEIRSADDSNELAVADHRHALDPIRLEQHCDVGEFGRVGDRDDVWGHDVLCRAAVRLDVVASKVLLRGDRIEPP